MPTMIPAMEQEQGTPLFSQALFLLPKSGRTEEASEFPMTDEQLIEETCSVVLLKKKMLS